MIRPPRLRPGDPVALVAPSGPLNAERFEAGRARIAQRYDLRFSQRLFERQGFLAGDDDARLRELELAIESPEVRGIVCARGGYGVMRLLARMDAKKLRRNPKPIVGFSDITALHAFVHRCGITSIHGPNVGQLASMPPADELALYALLEGETGSAITSLQCIGAQRVSEGPLLGGNLELVTRLLATPFAFELEGAVLLIEEVGEKPYRIDRALTQLALAGAWERVAGVVVGDLIDCTAPEGPSALEVVIERLSGLRVPVLLGLPVGHGERNRALGHGARVRVDGVSGVLTPLEAVTQ